MNITITDNVISIDDRAFSGRNSLSDINIPERVTSIGSGAFYGTGLEYVNPDSVISIGIENPFMGIF